MLPSGVPRLATDSAVRVFPDVWKLLSFLRLPSWDGALSLPLLSLFLSFIFFSYLLSKTMGSFSGCLLSFAVIQRLFCGIYSVFKCSFDEFVEEKVVSLSYSSAILGLPSKNCLLDSVGEGYCGMIWEGSIETCMLSFVKWIARPGSINETGCSRLVHWDDPGGWDGEGGGRGVLDGEPMCIHGWFISMFGKNHYNIVK